MLLQISNINVNNTNDIIRKGGSSRKDKLTVFHVIERHAHYSTAGEKCDFFRTAYVYIICYDFYNSFAFYRE